MVFMVFPHHFIRMLSTLLLLFLANGFKIDSQVDSGFQTLLDSGFHINVDSGLQSTGFLIPESVTWGEAFPTPYSKYH